jgi:hypothetical protein
MLRGTSKSEEPGRCNNWIKQKEDKNKKTKKKTKHAHNLSKGYEHKSIINYNLLLGCEI